MLKRLPALLLVIIFWHSGLFAQGNHVFSGAEAVNFGTVDLATPGGQTWSTFRGATPGYFSAFYPGTAYSNASNANNVNGYVKKYGNEVFTFPVGTGADLRTLSISAPGAATDAYATAWILGDPGGALDPTAPNEGAHSTASKGAGILSVSPVGQWDWQSGVDLAALSGGTETGNGAGLTITVSIPDMSAFALATNLRLVGWNGSMWIALGGATASGNAVNSTLSGTMVAGITAIGIGSTAFVLPLDLISFTGREQGCAAALSWTTANEVNTKNFSIEQSLDGSNYTAIGSVDAQGNGSGKTYSFTATQPNGTAYYRLKMIDIDGQFKYSAIQPVRTNCLDKNNYIKIFPNPVVTGNGDITINFKVEYTGKANVIFTNALGQQFVNKPIVITADANVATQNTAVFAAGTYFIQIISADGKRIVETQKFVKQN